MLNFLTLLKNKIDNILWALAFRKREKIFFDCSKNLPNPSRLNRTSSMGVAKIATPPSLPPLPFQPPPPLLPPRHVIPLPSAFPQPSLCALPRPWPPRLPGSGGAAAPRALLSRGLCWTGSSPGGRAWRGGAWRRGSGGRWRGRERGRGRGLGPWLAAGRGARSSHGPCTSPTSTTTWVTRHNYVMHDDVIGNFICYFFAYFCCSWCRQTAKGVWRQVDRIAPRMIIIILSSVDIFINFNLIKYLIRFFHWLRKQ